MVSERKHASTRGSAKYLYEATKHIPSSAGLRAKSQRSTRVTYPSEMAKKESWEKKLRKNTTGHWLKYQMFPEETFLRQWLKLDEALKVPWLSPNFPPAWLAFTTLTEGGEKWEKISNVKKETMSISQNIHSSSRVQWMILVLQAKVKRKTITSHMFQNVHVQTDGFLGPNSPTNYLPYSMYI